MLSTKITNGAEFIVFDLEWNQPMPGKKYGFEVSELTGEIIEIGAVKYIYDHDNFIRKDTFSVDIKPKKYTKIHFHVKKVTHKTNADLKNGIPFEDAYAKFSEFCGDNAILVGWGNSDPHVLKQNLKFFGLSDKLGLYFLDLQPIFSLFSGQNGKQRSVEFAVDYYSIEKKEMFHSATADAIYTGEIMENIFNRNKVSEVLSAISSSSIDADIQSEFAFVGQPSSDSGEALSYSDGFVNMCPLCSEKLTQKIERFKIRKSEYALLFCKKHGEFFCRTRLKKNKEGKFYAASVLRFATQNDYFLVAQKREEYEKFGEKGAPIPVQKPIEDNNAE